MRRTNEIGRSMIEMILYLSIMGVLATGALLLVGKVLDKVKMSRATAQIGELSKNISARYLAVGRYDEIDVDELGKGKVIPKDMYDNGTVTHAFGGKVIIKGTKRYFSITFQQLPQNVCVELSLLNWTVAETTNLVSIEITGSNAKKYVWKDGGGAGFLPITIQDAVSMCKKENNTIEWEFE